MHRQFATVAVESRAFHKNVQKLTGNTNNGHILNTVIKYSLFSSWQGNYLKASIPVTFARLSWQRFAKSERYKINWKHFHPRIIDLDVRLGGRLSY